MHLVTFWCRTAATREVPRPPNLVDLPTPLMTLMSWDITASDVMSFDITDTVWPQWGCCSQTLPEPLVQLRSHQGLWPVILNSREMRDYANQLLDLKKTSKSCWSRCQGIISWFDDITGLGISPKPENEWLSYPSEVLQQGERTMKCTTKLWKMGCKWNQLFSAIHQFWRFYVFSCAE